MRFLKILSFVSCTLGSVVLVNTQASALMLVKPASSVVNSDNFGSQAQQIVGDVNTALPVEVDMGAQNNALIPLVYDEHFDTVKSDIKPLITNVGSVFINVGSTVTSGAVSGEITPLSSHEIPEPSTVIGLTAIVSLVTINTLFKKGGKK